jgi:hypothetical protein
LRLRKTRARSGTAFKDGRLALEFDDGSSIHVPADPSYEPWQISGPRGFRIVSIPGGDLAIWSAQETESPRPDRNEQEAPPMIRELAHRLHEERAASRTTIEELERQLVYAREEINRLRNRPQGPPSELKKVPRQARNPPPSAHQESHTPTGPI